MEKWLQEVPLCCDSASDDILALAWDLKSGAAGTYTHWLTSNAASEWMKDLGQSHGLISVLQFLFGIAAS